MHHLKKRKLALAATTFAAAGALCLVGCSSSAEPSPVNVPNGMLNGMPGGQGGFPGANGEIAAVSGNTLQVQSDSAQTAVTYEASTTITQTLPSTLAKVTVGECVSANGEESSGSLTAQMVRVSSPVEGECTSTGPGNGMGPGQRGVQAPPDSQGYGPPPGGGDMTPPEGAPPGMPEGGFTFANGKVVSKTANTIVISGQMMTRGSDGPSNSTGNVTISVASDTTYTVESTTSASAIKVGLCVRAMGEANDKGTVAARSLSLSEPTDGECQLGFGGRR